MANDDARSAAIHVRRFLVAGALCCLSLSSAHAGWASAPSITKGPPTVSYNARNVAVLEANPTLARNSLQRVLDTVPSGVSVSDAVKVGLGGAVIDVIATKVVSSGSLPAVAVAVAAGGGMVIGGAINQWFDAAGVRVDPSGGFEYIPPENPSAPGSGSWGWSGISPGNGYSTPEAACVAIAAMYGATMNGLVYLSPTQYQCRTAYHGSLAVISNTVTCPFGQPDSSGKCPYNGTWQPAPPGSVPDLLSSHPPPNPAGVVGEAVDSGVEVPAGSPSLSGPSSTPGPSTTRTGPDGVTNVTVTNNYTYGGDTITVTQTTNTTHPDGTTETETTEEVPEPTECDKNPSLLSCAELDEPESSEIPKDTENITFQAEDVFGGGQCPANVQASFATIGKSATIVDWQTFCGHALPLRALVIGLASIMAMFIIMPGGKVE